jgi:hypothetical protein
MFSTKVRYFSAEGAKFHLRLLSPALLRSSWRLQQVCSPQNSEQLFLWNHLKIRSSKILARPTTQGWKNPPLKGGHFCPVFFTFCGGIWQVKSWCFLAALQATKSAQDAQYSRVFSSLFLMV